ncbi:MAG: DUF1844 domain-containing protein [Deltaproteobacteria bacterium]
MEEQEKKMEQEKKVDQEWKQKVEQEKQRVPQEAAGGEEQLPEADFSFFVTSLAMQAAISLGQLPNPVTQKVEENLGHAKLIIDTLGMLREKTRGNLSAEEDSLLDNYLYDLRTQYIAKTKEPK